MAALDDLPADQRAVLQLVLQRGRSYLAIASLLSIDRAAVRQRAHAALDAIGPQTGVTEERRALVGDYLLGQLDDEAAERTRTRISESPSERAWARVLASELAPLSSSPLPTIPSAATPAAASAHAPVLAAAAGEAEEHGRRRRGRRERPPKPEATPEPRVPREPATSDRRSSRLGGILLIGLTLVIVAGVAVLLLSSSSGTSHSSSTRAAAPGSTTAASTASASTTTTPKVLAQINLTPPTSKSKAAGIAEVLREGTRNGIAIVAQRVPPNQTKPPNAYAVWLYNSGSDAQILGFVNPGVGANGRLSTAGGLPTNASHFKQLIVTLETKANPKTPGPIVLQGAMAGL